MTNKTRIEVAILGAGQAGISLSYYLQKHGIPHILLERDRPFASWYNRWEGFVTNTPNFLNTLPVLDPKVYPSNNSQVFATREEILAYFEKCLEAVNPPVQTNVDVYKISQREDSYWDVFTHDMVYEARNVVIANGAMSVPKIPEFAADLPDSIPSLHSSEYLNPAQIKTGSVLIVGGASSGVQICKLLGESNRFEGVHLSTTPVTVLPERVMGIRIHNLIHLFGLFDVRKDSLMGRLMFYNLKDKADPIVKPTPKELKNQFGVQLYGKLTGTEGNQLIFEDGQSLKYDDLSILWCTGFKADYSFIEMENRDVAFDQRGYPIHKRGVIAGAPGLYFVGLRYQYTIASHDIYGVGRDARYVAHHIHGRQTSPYQVPKSTQLSSSTLNPI